MDIKEFLAKCTVIPHVSGYENSLTQMLSEDFSKYADCAVDKFGSLVAHRAGADGGPVVMLSAHVDEIGMMVRAVCDGGFVQFSHIGGIDGRNILAQEVTIHGRKPVFGVIGIKPPHLTSEADRKKAVNPYDMAIDTGLPKSKLDELVRPGDIITINQDLVELKGGKLAGKAMDNLAGVAAMFHAMQLLEFYKHDAHVYFVASAQEEVGCRGAKVATHDIRPDIGIAIDVTFGKAPGLTEFESSPLGKGPVLTVGPNITRKLFESLKSVAKANTIPHQVDVAHGMTGTDAYMIQIGEGGVMTAVVSIPLRYMHSTVETLAVDDVKNCGRLLADYIISLNGGNWCCDVNGKEAKPCCSKN